MDRYMAGDKERDLEPSGDPAASSVYALLRQVISRHGARTAIKTPGKSDMSFESLGEEIIKAREALAGLGFGRGSRIGLMIRERDAFASAYLGVISCATAVPINPDRTESELEFAFGDFRLDALIVDALSEEARAAAAPGLRILEIEASNDAAGRIDIDVPKSVSRKTPEMPMLDDAVVLNHTSGTTSRPKIVPRTNRNGLATVHYEWKVSPIDQSDCALNVLPLFNAQGLLGDFQPVLLRGASVALAEFDPERFDDLVVETQSTFFTLVPSMHSAVMRALGPQSRHEFDNLRFVRSSSAALTPGLKEEIERRFGVPVVQAYGSSEAGGVAMSGISPETQREGSVGRPLHSGVAVMDEQGNTLPAGTEGEVCVTGPHVMAGYVDDPDLNAVTFRDGWYRSGDMGYMDEDGFLFLTGRIRETINRGGELISPQQVDEVLERHEAVSQAAAFGVKDPELGEEIWAAVVLSPGSDVEPTVLRAFAALHLSFSRVPKRLFLVDQVPTNSSGKIVRSELSQRFGLSAVEGSEGKDRD